MELEKDGQTFPPKTWKEIASVILTQFGKQKKSHGRKSQLSIEVEKKSSVQSVLKVREQEVASRPVFGN